MKKNGNKWLKMGTKNKNGKFEVKDRVKQIVEDYEQIRGKANYV